jgi:hypothetical protein
LNSSRLLLQHGRDDHEASKKHKPDQPTIDIMSTSEDFTILMPNHEQLASNKRAK